MLENYKSKQVYGENSLSQPLSLVPTQYSSPEITSVAGFFWILLEMVYADPNARVRLDSLFFLFITR